MIPARNRTTIRFQLTCLVLTCVVPVWLISGALVFLAYSSKLDNVKRDLLATARSTTMIVDRELTSVQAALQALTTSPSFTNGDMEGLHRQAVEVLKAYPGADIIVADATGQQLVNSFLPYGSPLPKRNNINLVRNIFESGKPIISNLFFGAVTRRPLIALDVPVFRDGKVVNDLSMTFSSDRMASILSSQKLPDGWYSSVLDGNRVVVARTRNPRQIVGKQATPELRQAMASTAEGTVELNNIEGTPVFVAFSQSSLSGWSVVAGVPRATLMAETYQWMWWAVGSATIISLMGIIIAMGIAGRIAHDIQSLVKPALSIGHGALITSTDKHSVKETAEVAEALVQASELLQRRAGERDNAERQLSSTMEELKRETAERLRAMEELRERDRLFIQQGRQAAMGEMIGNIAHQWRQPLNVLGMIIQRLSLFHELGSFSKEFLDTSTRDAMKLIQHMSNTIEDFRNFFKPDKERTDFCVNEAIRHTINLVDNSFKHHQIDVATQAAGEARINGYPNEFSQAVLNILQNARDALVERDIAGGLVTVASAVENGKAVITIRDNAGGIPEEIMDRIFEPYFSTKGTNGTGIGLYMSKNIIETNMGGRITVRNIPGGTEFRIEV